MLVHEFLSCPHCDDRFEDVVIGVDGEHITIECRHCETGVKEFHEDFKRFDGAP